MLIPSQIIITRVRPSLWLPGLEISWGILTGLIAACSSAKQIYAIRTFLGVCESSAYPGSEVLFPKTLISTRIVCSITLSPVCYASSRSDGPHDELVHPYGNRQANGFLPLMPSCWLHDVRCTCCGHPANSRRVCQPCGMEVALHHQLDHDRCLGDGWILDDPRCSKQTQVRSLSILPSLLVQVLALVCPLISDPPPQFHRLPLPSAL